MSLPVGFGVSSEPQQRATGTSSLSAGRRVPKGRRFAPLPPPWSAVGAAALLSSLGSPPARYAG